MKLVCEYCGSNIKGTKTGNYIKWYCKKCKQEVEPIRKSKYAKEVDNG